jgi:type IV pilus assembly protein PilY1
VYGGDNLGQMWRFDLTDKTNFTVSKILMGSAGASHPISARPEVSSCMAGGAVKRVVVFGTGRLLDVPDTQDKTTVHSLYVLKDEDGAAGNPVADIRGSTMVQQTMTRSGTSNYLISSNDVDLRAKNGWFVDWSLNGGERMNLDPKIVNGGISVVTNVPGESSSCSVGGASNVYQYSVCSGSLPSSDMIVGSTLSNTAAAVGFIVVGLSDGRTKGVATLANGDKKNFDRTPLQSRGARKAGWRRVTR